VIFQPCVYIAASRPRGTLYVGVTSDVSRRMWEHRGGLLPGFTKTYGIRLLVYYEHHQTMDIAITREKQIKEWRRAWKIELIIATNPEWDDLYDQLNT
jgi:putative endonuclease